MGEAQVAVGVVDEALFEDDVDRHLDEGDDGTGGRPEVPRGELRRILLGALPLGSVRWGHKLTSVATLGRGQHLLHFANGATATSDLLAGADGAWSRVRPLLSSAQPAYSGIAFIETCVKSSKKKGAWIAMPKKV